MLIDRRGWITSTLGIATIGLPALASTGNGTGMYGLIGKMMAVPGQREALIAILLEATGEMPGCLSYIVATDPGDANAIWITEVWDDQANHKASLTLPAVRAAISRARPMIAGFGDSFTTAPVGGYGLRTSG
jgi:quinol monooxygenase YgiN